MTFEKVIRTYSSSFDDNVALVVVVLTPDCFVVRVLGESEMTFATEQEALLYAEHKARDF